MKASACSQCSRVRSQASRAAASVGAEGASARCSTAACNPRASCATTPYVGVITDSATRSTTTRTLPSGRDAALSRGARGYRARGQQRGDRARGTSATPCRGRGRRSNVASPIPSCPLSASPLLLARGRRLAQSCLHPSASGGSVCRARSGSTSRTSGSGPPRTVAQARGRGLTRPRNVLREAL